MSSNDQSFEECENYKDEEMDELAPIEESGAKKKTTAPVKKPLSNARLESLKKAQDTRRANAAIKRRARAQEYLEDESKVKKLPPSKKKVEKEEVEEKHSNVITPDYSMYDKLFNNPGMGGDVNANLLSKLESLEKKITKMYESKKAKQKLKEKEIKPVKEKSPLKNPPVNDIKSNERSEIARLILRGSKR